MYKILVEIPEGWGYFSGQKMEIPGRGGLREIPLCDGGMDIFWNYTNLIFFSLCVLLSRVSAIFIKTMSYTGTSKDKMCC